MKDNNKLNQRREFYIHQIVRNGKMYDDEEKNEPKKEKTPLEVNQGKKVISYAESFGYRESPSRYDNLRPRREEKPVEKESPVNKIIETPQSDPTIGYYDEGLKYEEEINTDELAGEIDDIYQESFENTTFNDTTMSDMTFESTSFDKPVVDYSEPETSYTSYQGYPINREDIKPKEKPVKKIEEPEMPKATPIRTEPTMPVKKETGPSPTRVEKPKPVKVKKTKYIAPGIDLLTRSGKDNQDDELEAKRQSEIINKTFKESGIKAEVASFIFGPTVTQFLITIEEGTNVKDIRKAESNLLMYLQCESIRIQTPIPGKPFAGIEVPKKLENRRTVFLGDMLASKDFKNLDYQVPVAVGQDNYGNYYYIDLTEMPHGLVAGTTKSGKSVCLNAFILSLIYRFSPDQLRIVLIDPKRIELGIYEGIPHLAMPVITDNEDFQSALGWVYEEMERRYKEFEIYDERNIVDYNAVRKEANEPVMPYLIVMMDEFGDWFADASSEIEMYMQKLAQKARAAGINIILATQRPSKDVIKGTIKANFDTRIAFRVSSWDDSKIILGASGAERLEGKGDMLIRYAGRAEQRFQGAFVPSIDIKKVTKFLKENNPCNYLVTKEEIHQSTVTRQAAATQTSKTTGRSDERFEEIAYWVVRNKNASVNQITQIFGMGFNRVNDIILALEEMHVISQGVKGKQREVLMDEYQLTDLLESEE